MGTVEILTLIEQVVAWGIKQEPAVQQALQNIFAKPNPTPADWQAERQAAGATYRDLVPNTALPTDVAPATPPATGNP